MLFLWMWWAGAVAATSLAATTVAVGGALSLAEKPRKR